MGCESIWIFILYPDHKSTLFPSSPLLSSPLLSLFLVIVLIEFVWIE